MKNTIKKSQSLRTVKLHVISLCLIAVIGFSMAACGDADNGGDTGNSAAPSEPMPFNDITAAQLVADIKIGWNLGNSLDAYDLTWLPANPTVTQLETGWSNPVTTKAMITAVKNAGFNAIRIPVSWDKASDSKHKIRADWMKRVTIVVNYAVDNDMYVILNTHHDEHIFKFTEAEKTTSLAAFRKIWEQIADNFKNYNEKLIFEGLNEPRTKGSAQEWSGGTAAEHAVLNDYYPVFIDVVRKSGGNNDKRILMINTYAASSTPTALDGLTLPTDTIANKLIVSVHAYEPYNFALNEAVNFNTWSSSNPADTSPINAAIDNVYNKFVSNGTPVIMGEFGAVVKDNESSRAQWAEYYVTYAAGKGIKCVYWDDGGLFKLFNRQNNQWLYPQVVTALMKGATSQ